jgi:trk system potassium uptake protein TrkA
MKYIVFGLGNFGRALSIRLTELGHEVIGVDNSMEKVEKLRDKITHTVCMDCTDKDAVSSLPLKDCDGAIVAIGEDESASLLTTALLKQLGVQRIIGRVVSDLQQVVLEAIQIAEYIRPETESALRLAMRLDNVSIVDSFKISDKYSIVEVVVPQRYVGLTLEAANFTNEYKIIVLTTIKVNGKDSTSKGSKSNEVTGIAKSSTKLDAGDILVVFGEFNDINRLIKR